MARVAVATLLALVCMAQLAAAYPVFFYRQNKPCLAQPDRKYKGHAAPVPDPSTKFEVLNEASKPVTSVCPGATYSLKLSFVEKRYALVTAGGVNFTGSDEECPGRLAVDRSTSPPLGGYSPDVEYTVNMTVLCNATGPIIVNVTSAAASKSGYQASSTTLVLGAACNKEACPAGAAAVKKAKAAAKAAEPAKAAKQTKEPTTKPATPTNKAHTDKAATPSTKATTAAKPAAAASKGTPAAKP